MHKTVLRRKTKGDLQFGVEENLKRGYKVSREFCEYWQDRDGLKRISKYCVEMIRE